MTAKRIGPVGGGIIPGAGRKAGPIKTRNPHARQLFELARKQRVTMAELARRSGYTVSTLSYLRGGHSAPLLTTFTDAAEAIGYDVVLVKREPKN